MIIGEKIKKIRELRNFTQDYMATQLEMTQAGYSRIERDEVDISFSKLEKIAKIFNINLLELIGFNEKNVFNNNFNNFSNTTNGFIIGTNEQLKEIYEARISDLQKEIAYLRGIVEKSLQK